MRLEPLLSVTARMRMQEVGATPEGHRMDLHIDGTTDPGGRLAGRLVGVDYLTIRGDGVARLDVRALLHTDDGPVAVRGGGIGTPLSGGEVAGRLALTFQTPAADLAWLNRVLAVAVTRSNRAAGELSFAVFTVEE